MISYTENNYQENNDQRVLSTDRAVRKKRATAHLQKQKEIDPTLKHEAVVLVQGLTKYRYRPNHGFRREIVATAEADMTLWRQVVALWATPYVDESGKRRYRNPLNYKGMMSEFDRLYFG